VTEPLVHELLRTARHEAAHLETRDAYTPNDPDWLAWRAGERFDPALRWSEWFDLMAGTTARGIRVRRARVVSEPVTDYIRFEYEVTAGHNVKAGECVRWMPRHQAPAVLVPAMDFWVIDREVVVWNRFAGDGSWIGEEVSRDPDAITVCVASFAAVWDRSIPHEEYHPA
jgi:hypothetical protein